MKTFATTKSQGRIIITAWRRKIQPVTTMYEHIPFSSRPRNPEYRPGEPDVRTIITVTKHGRYAQTFDIADHLDPSWRYLDDCRQRWGWPVWWPGGPRIFVFAAGAVEEGDQ